MSFRRASVCSLALFVILYAGAAAGHGDALAPAHGGGLDELGCHHDRQRGGYHCHQGALAGRSFPSKEAAIAELDNQPPPSPPDQTGCVDRGFAARVTRVRDGDTIVVGDLPIRLQGIAAPELGERGGPRAAREMGNLVLNREVWCDLDGGSTFDRCSAICYLGVRDIGAVMVRRGLARDCPSFSRGRYERLERLAVAEGAIIRRIYPLPSYCG